MKNIILRTILPIALLLGGGFLARMIMTQAPTAERKPVAKAIPIVELQRITPAARTAVIEATGLVTPAQQVSLMPQVSGEVVYVSDALVPGGHVKKGQLLVRIDPRDYKLAVEQQQGSLRSAELQVELEKAQQELAAHEWSVLGEDGQPSPLFSRESQRAAAEASLGSGRRGLDRAKLNLARTQLRAPFDATVVTENVDMGQVVGPSFQLAQLMGTGELWVTVGVPVAELELVQIPGVNAEEGSSATVEQRLANGKAIVRKGRVTRLVNKLDERTRRAQVIVTVEDALSPELGLPLLAGAYVQVAIEGQPFEQVFSIPREAVYEGNVVWVVGNDGTLTRREAAIAWGDAKNVYATSGLEAGDRLVLTRLSAPIPGMKVQPLDEASSAASGDESAKSPPSAESAAAVAPQGAATAPKEGVN